MNLKELQSDIRINIDDPNGETIGDDSLRLMINRAIRKVWNELSKNGIYLKKRVITLSFVSGTQEVVITAPYNISKIIVLQDIDGNVLNIAEEEFAKRSRESCYYISRQVTVVGSSNIRNDKLGYYIVPDQSWNVNLIVCDQPVEFSPSASSGTTFVDIPEEHHDLLVTWATIQILIAQEEPIEIWMSLWNDQLIDLLEAVGFQNKNLQSVVDVIGD